MSKKNNPPDQKAQWKANQKLGSRFVKVTPAPLYNPPKKAPSRRDLHRIAVAEAKRK